MKKLIVIALYLLSIYAQGQVKPSGTLNLLNSPSIYRRAADSTLYLFPNWDRLLTRRDSTTNSPIIRVNGTNLFSTRLTNTATNVTGTVNSNFFGPGAGYNATTASNSNFIGYQAGYNSSASYSNYFGYQAGWGTATSSNVSNFIGLQAGYNAGNSNGSNFVGNGSGYGAYNSYSSNFIGSGAGYIATGSTYSNFIGTNVGNSSTNSTNSNFIGSSTGSSTTTNYSNLMGYHVGFGSTGHKIGNNNLIIGTNITLPNATANAMNLGGILFGTNTYATTTGTPSEDAVSNGKVGIGVLPANISARLMLPASVASAGMGSLKIPFGAALPTPEDGLFEYVTIAGNTHLWFTRGITRYPLDQTVSMVLTTSGTSGASTLRGDTLNIPVYGGSGGGINLTDIHGDSPILYNNTNGHIAHDTVDGFHHVPATSTTNYGKVLTAGASAGALYWITPTYMTYPGAGIAVSNGSGAWSASLADSSAYWGTGYRERLRWDGGTGAWFNSATARNSLGGTTVGQAFYTLANPSAIRYPQINANNSVSALTATELRDAIGAETGTLTTVATGLGLTGGPITSAGTISMDTASTTVLSRQRALHEYQPKGVYVTSVATGLGLTGGTISTAGTLAVDTANASILSRQRADRKYLTAVTGTLPIVSSQGLTPAISINAATTTTAGSMSAADKAKLNSIATGANTGTVQGVSTGIGLLGGTITTTGTVYVDTTSTIVLSRQRALHEYNPLIPAGISSQYWRGDKTMQTLNTFVVPELTNLYFTNSRVEADSVVTTNKSRRHYPVTLTVPSGLSITPNQVLSVDTASAMILGRGRALHEYQPKGNYLSGTPWTTSGIANYIPKYTTGGVTFANSLIYDNGINVLIGGTTPSFHTPSKLNVFGGAYFGDYNSWVNLDLEGQINLRLLDNIHGIIKPNWADNVRGGITLQYTGDGIGTMVDGIKLDYRGMVGINTSSPSTQLHLHGNGLATDGLTIETTSYTSIPFPGSLASNNILLNARGLGMTSWSDTLSTAYRPSFGIGITSGGNEPLIGLKQSKAGKSALVVEKGFVGLGYSTDPGSGNAFGVNGSSYFSGNSANGTLYTTNSLVNGVGAYGYSTATTGTGIGGAFASLSPGGSGILGYNTSSGLGGSFSSNPTSTNTIYDILEIKRNGPATPISGIGAGIRFMVGDNSGTATLSNHINSWYSNTTSATRQGNLTFTGMGTVSGTGVELNLVTMYGSGLTQLTMYGHSTPLFSPAALTKTLTKYLGIDASGFILEVDPPTAGTGTVTGITAGLGLTGGTINVSGTIAIDTASVSILSRQRAVNTYQPKGTYVTGTPWTAMNYLVSGGALGTPSSGTLTNCTFPTLNQNTTGSAAILTTARTIAGTSFNGSANISLPNKFIVQGTTDTGLSGAQFLGALNTGIVRNTTTTGVLTIATGADLPEMSATVGGAVPTPPNDVTKYLNGQGGWTVPAGSGTGITSIGLTMPTGFTSPATLIANGTLAVNYASGYSTPTTANQTKWDRAATDTLHWDGGSTSLVAATGRASLQIPFAVQALSGTTVAWNVNNGLNATLTMTGATAITLSGLVAGQTGNIRVTTNSAAAYALTIAGYTNKISPAIWTGTANVLKTSYTSGTAKVDVFSWWYDGTNVIWNGTNGYN